MTAAAAITITAALLAIAATLGGYYIPAADAALTMGIRG